MVSPRLAVVTFLVGACSVGEVPIGGVDGGAGGSQAGFDATIKPLVISKGCVSCHSAGQPPNFTSYATLDPVYRRAPSSSNKLILEAADGALHNGFPYFTTQEKTTVKNWIDGR
jgi:hypothetical protein